MSDMARIPLELGLRADANWFHDARRTTGINNRMRGGLSQQSIATYRNIEASAEVLGRLAYAHDQTANWQQQDVRPYCPVRGIRKSRASGHNSDRPGYASQQQELLMNARLQLCQKELLRDSKQTQRTPT